MKNLIFLTTLILGQILYSQNNLVFRINNNTINDTLDVSQLYIDLGTNADKYIDTLDLHLGKSIGTSVIVNTTDLWYDNLFTEVLKGDYSGKTLAQIKMMSLMAAPTVKYKMEFIDRLKTERLINDGQYDIAQMVADQDTVQGFDVYRGKYEMYYDRCFYEGVALSTGTLGGFKYVILKNGDKLHYADYYLVKEIE